MPSFFQLTRVLGVILCFFVLLLYCRILVHQHRFVNENTLTHRLVVLNVRTALLVPVFAIGYLISFEFSGAYLYMQLPQTIAQGYATFSFVALFVHYCGGPEQCIEIIKNSNAYFPSICFRGTCLDLNRHPKTFYSFIYYTQVIFLVCRPLLVVVVIITSDTGHELTSNIVSGVASSIVLIGIGGLLKMFHVLYDSLKGLNAKTKIIVIKGTIGVVLIESLIEQVLVAFDVIDDASLTQSFRLYCFFVLIELFVLSLILERVFASEIKTDKALNQAFAPHIVINAADDGVNYITYFELISAVLYFRDLFAPLRLAPEAGSDPSRITRTTISASPSGNRSIISSHVSGSLLTTSLSSGNSKKSLTTAASLNVNRATTSRIHGIPEDSITNLESFEHQSSMYFNDSTVGFSGEVAGERGLNNMRVSANIL